MLGIFRSFNLVIFSSQEIHSQLSGSQPGWPTTRFANAMKNLAKHLLADRMPFLTRYQSRGVAIKKNHAKHNSNELKPRSNDAEETLTRCQSSGPFKEKQNLRDRNSDRELLLLSQSPPGNGRLKDLVGAWENQLSPARNLSKLQSIHFFRFSA